jgi:hypothetical protein
MAGLDRPASFEGVEMSAPPTSGIDGITTLMDFAIISYAVDPEVVLKHLPDGFEPELFTLKNGEKKALISVVTFRELDFYLKMFPWIKLAFNQINYRAYVTYGGQRAVWFFANCLATPLYFVPRNIWQMPWCHSEIDLQTIWYEGVCRSYKATACDPWGTSEVNLTGTGQSPGILDGFINHEDMSVILTHPLVGYYRRRDGHIGSYDIWHDRLQMQLGVAQNIRIALWEKLDLCAADAQPHSVLLQQTADFIIKLPPRKVRGGD